MMRFDHGTAFVPSSLGGHVGAEKDARRQNKVAACVSDERARAVAATFQSAKRAIVRRSDAAWMRSRRQSRIVRGSGGSAEDVKVEPTGIAVPQSFEAAVDQAGEALRAAFRAGYSRVLIEVDTTVGDETYTALKNAIPLAKAVANALVALPQDQLPPLELNSNSKASAKAPASADGGSGDVAKSDDDGDNINNTKNNDNDVSTQRGDKIKVVLPDTGAAALLQRDWSDRSERVVLAGLEREVPSADDAGFVIVVPRASEVQRLEQFASKASPLFSAKGARAFVLVNPDLVDMGVTGLGLTARQLRERFLSSFETAYYLKALPWGVLLRAYPGKWAVWVDAADAPGGFALAKEFARRPTSDELDEVLEAAETSSGGGNSASKPGVFAKLSRFLKMYMKG
mmetsp:Transcript_11228/g.30231  ORF Transcript_11228/g.30231 Transcript_11228/m.30231 type:complete len:399 (-) Transcript_11228:62-1258(-)